MTPRRHEPATTPAPGECTTFTAGVQVKDHPDKHR